MLVCYWCEKSEHDINEEKKVDDPESNKPSSFIILTLIKGQPPGHEQAYD